MLCWHLPGLFRSIDLAPLFRVLPNTNDVPNVLCQRKGWREPRFEAGSSLPDKKSISPWHLLQQYVS